MFGQIEWMTKRQIRPEVRHRFKTRKALEDRIKYMRKKAVLDESDKSLLMELIPFHEDQDHSRIALYKNSTPYVKDTTLYFHGLEEDHMSIKKCVGGFLYGTSNITRTARDQHTLFAKAARTAIKYHVLSPTQATLRQNSLFALAVTKRNELMAACQRCKTMEDLTCDHHGISFRHILKEFQRVHSDWQTYKIMKIRDQTKNIHVNESALETRWTRENKEAMKNLH